MPKVIDVMLGTSKKLCKLAVPCDQRGSSPAVEPITPDSIVTGNLSELNSIEFESTGFGWIRVSPKVVVKAEGFDASPRHKRTCQRKPAKGTKQCLSLIHI